MRLIDLATYLVYAATYVIVVPILVALLFFSDQSKALKILFVGLVAVFLFDVLLLFFAAKNTFLYIFTTIDVLMLSRLFSVAILNKRVSKLVWLLGLLFVPLIGLDAFLWSGLQTNGICNTLEKLFILAAASYYMRQLLQDESVDYLTKEPLFWVSIGVILYNMVGVFDGFSKPMLTYSQTLYLQFYLIWSLTAILMYGCFAFAFWPRKSLPVR